MRYTRKHRQTDRTARITWSVFRNKHNLPSDILQWKQHGGGRGRIVTQGGYRYYVRESMDGDTLEIRGGGIPEKSYCFMLMISPGKTAELHDLRRGAICSLDGPDAPTGNMVHLAVRLARERGVQTLHIQDMARVPIAQGSPFRLADVSLLTTGQSWYHQFLPLTSNDDDSLARWRTIIETNIWDKVFACLTSIKGIVIVPDGVTAGIDTSAAGSAKAVLTRIKQMRTDFFVTYLTELIPCSGVSSIYGWTWTYSL